jgi:Cu-Zn family superoxide dismutase
MNKFSGLGVALLIAAVVLTLGCGAAEDHAHNDDGSHPGEDAASATEAAPASHDHATQLVINIEPKNDSGMTGTATFSDDHGTVTLLIEIAGATPGEHAFHLHEIGDCSAADGTSAGGHWNPTAMDHGKWGTEPHHLGDVGNIVVDETGKGSYRMDSTVWSIGTGEPGDIVGRAVIVHAGVDDYTSQPTGAAGGRIGCGVIQLTE